MTTKITADNIEQATLDNLGSGPLISNVQITSNTYVVLDDTAVSLDGGFVIINGSKFDSNVNVLIDGTPAVSVSQISPSQIRAEVPPLSAGSKIVYLVNTDTGATAIRINGLTYSGFPTWVTDSALPEGEVDSFISIQLNATSDSNVSYSLSEGSSLPEGLTLAANGLLSGTITGLEDDTLYNFTVEATDEELQNSPRSFSVTITAVDQFFKQTVLLLNGDGTNGAQNNTFLDGSSNNFTITRNGNTTQGTFSPYNTAWSNYFDGTGDYLTIPNNEAFNLGTGDFTFECWAMFEELSTSTSTGDSFFSGNGNPSVDFAYLANSLRIGRYPIAWDNTFAFTPNLYQWYHIAYTRSSGTLRVFVNGSLIGSDTNTISYTVTGTALIGSDGDLSSRLMKGYISNHRLIKGTAVYTSNFTPPTSPLTAITNTSLLTCQSNRFRDASTNNFTITRNGDVRVTPFSPFAPSAAYDPAVNGGSGYFDGNDSLTGSTSVIPATSAFTIEMWIYIATTSNDVQFFAQWSSGTAGRFIIDYSNTTYAGATNKFVFGVAGPGALLQSSITSDRSVWNHLVVARNNSNNWAMWVNGTRVATATNSVSLQQLRPAIGNIDTSATSGLNGYLSGVRVITSDYYGVDNLTITVPTAPPTAIANTSLLLNFTNGGITDATGRNNLETVGDARLDTSIKKYGTGSMKFDGTGDNLTIRSNDTLWLGSGQFTIEMWLYPNDASSQQMLLAGSDTGSIFLGMNIDGANRIALGRKGVSVDNFVSYTYSTGAWIHLAVTRDSSNNVRFFVGGTQVGSTGSNSNSFTNSALNIGFEPTQKYLNGYIDDLRITKGVARYTANFTPPTKAHQLK